MNIRVGFGYDVHAFEDGRKLYLGGIEVPFERGLKGHSDADVLIHAICDALLGALSLGDIGQHFPDTDPKYKDIDSKILLKHVNEIIENKEWRVINIDSTVVIERPKLKDHIPQMKNTLADIINLNSDQISIKATTSEKMGFVGLEDGVKALATVLLMKGANN